MENIPTIDDLQALFLLYCSEGRTKRVVLGSTDGLYGQRLQSSSGIDTMSQRGFEIMIRDLPGLAAHPRGASVPMGFIFSSNVGVTHIAMSPSGRAVKDARVFELPFDHWMDALTGVAGHVYKREVPPSATGPGSLVSDVALALLLSRHVRPLISKRFMGTEAVGADSALDDAAAMAMGLAPSAVADAWDWAAANALPGRPLVSRLVLTEDSVKTDVEALVRGLRGVPLRFSEVRDNDKFATRLRAKLTSFTGGAPTPEWAGGEGASSASSTLQMALSPSLARQAAPSTRDRVAALSASTGGEGSPGGRAQAAYARVGSPLGPAGSGAQPARAVMPSAFAVGGGGRFAPSPAGPRDGVDVESLARQLQGMLASGELSSAQLAAMVAAAGPGGGQQPVAHGTGV